MNLAAYYAEWKTLIASGMDMAWWQEFFVKFYQAFIEADRWKQYLDGVGTTLMATALALVLGVVLGVLVAMIRTAPVSYTHLIFGSFFGGGFGGGRRTNPNAPQRGESIRLSLAISFEEAAFGCEKEVSVDRMEQCGTCHGNGCAAGTTPEVCPDCHGTGQVQVRRQTPMGVFATSSPCGRCGGKGKIIHQPCPDCRGSGAVRRRKTIQVSIPAGIDNGQTISVRGQGSAGKNGGPAGDLLVTITVRPHELFRREGTSVLCDAPITFAQAVLGAELEIPTIDGKVKYDLPEGTQSGTTFRLKGKGIPAINGRGRGDQYVTVYIETPRNLNREQKEALKKFAESVGDNNYEERRKFFRKFKK